MKKTKSISREKIKKIANLAMLKLEDRELDKFTKQLSSIVEFVSQLNEIDTKKVKTTSQVTGLENVFREDKVFPSLSQKEALSNAPSQHNGYIKVKPVFKDQ